MSHPTVEETRIAYLVEQLTAMDEAYYNTSEDNLDDIVDDAVYDAMRDELRSLDATNPYFSRVGAKAGASLAKVTLSIPMGSLDKAQNETEYNDFCKKLPDTTQYTATLKMDGGSVSLEYKDGELVQAVTRGDGLIGEDITENVKKFYKVPSRNVKLNGKKFSGFVRGEIILTIEKWKEADPTQAKNPRNLGNGICRRKSGFQAELLTIYAFRAHYTDGSVVNTREDELIEDIISMGFNVSEHTTGTKEDIWAFYQNILAKRDGLPFWIDGIVMKVTDIEYQLSLGERDNRPKGQFAVKFPPSGADTVLLAINWTVGQTGAIIPTGQFKPVPLGGTTVSNALLYNCAFITSMDIALNDEVHLFKSGDIIPKVMRVTKRPSNRIPIDIPTHCPVCASLLDTKLTSTGAKSKVLFCGNDVCGAKISGKLNRFINAVQIMGIGDKVLDSMIAELAVKTPADLYRLSVDQLAAMPFGSKRTAFGVTRSTSIVNSIQSKKEFTLPQLIGSIGIEDLAVKRAEQIQQQAPGEFENLEDWFSGKLALKAVEIGFPTIGERLSRSLQQAQPLLEDLLSTGIVLTKPKVKSTATDSKSFCLTGALSQPRNYFVDLIESKGHVFKPEVAKGLDYLVVADPSSTSSKVVKAKKLGVICIDEAGLLELLK